MKLTRGKRIALELFGPALIGAGLPLAWTLAMAVAEIGSKSGPDKWKPTMLPQAGYILFIAYACTGLQSAAYTIILEWRFTRGLNPRSGRSVGLSSLLGLASGVPIALGYGTHRADLLFVWLLWCGVGLAVGFLMGLLIQGGSAETKTAEKEKP